MQLLTNYLLKNNVTRDWPGWLWLQLVPLAGLVCSGVFDIPKAFAYIGVPIGDVGVHRIIAAAAVVLYFAGKYNPSPLPADKGSVSLPISRS